MAHSKEVIEQFKVLREKGHSADQIALVMGVPKRTIICWVNKFGYSWPKGFVTKDRHAMMVKNIRTAQQTRQKHYTQLRETQFKLGLESKLSLRDALCAGLYWGEGAKYRRSWGFSNSDRVAVREMILWAGRFGHGAENFIAAIHIHPEDTVTDDDVRDYWKWCGIEKEKIRIYRFRSKSSSKKTKRKIPFGTCALALKGARSGLFEFYAGQLSQICSALGEK
jgi:hypothetical protein